MSLTCEVESNAPAELSWTGPSGAEVTDGAGVSIIHDEVDFQTTRSILVFHPLRVSHAGQYTCRSTLEKFASVKEASAVVSVQGKETELHFT